MKISKTMNMKNIENISVLTPMQEGMLFHYLKNPRSDVYFVQLSLELNGVIDINYLKDAWNLIIQSNDALRTIFRWDKLEKPVQIILKSHNYPFFYHDISNLKKLEKKKQLENIKINDRRKSFSLREVPFRVILCKIKDNQFEMVISSHHILFDGWSNGVILKEFFKNYNQLSNSQQTQKIAKTKFSEFVKWLNNNDLKNAETYWRSYLRSFDTYTEFSIKKNKIMTPEIGEVEIHHVLFSSKKKKNLDQWLKEKKLTLASILYGIWGFILQRYNNCNDVVFGTTVSGRSAKIKGIENIVGLFMNTIPLRVKHTLGDKVIDLLHNINNDLIIREEHEHTSLVRIKSFSELDNSEELFDTIIVIENYPINKNLIESKGDQRLKVNSFSMWERPHYDLTISILLSEEIEISIIYNKSRFLQESIARLGKHFLSLLNQLSLENFIEQEIEEIDLLSDTERNELLISFNNTQTEYAYRKCIHQLFQEQSEMNSDGICLVGQLAGMSDKNANYKTQGQTNEGFSEALEIERYADLSSHQIQLTFGEFNLRANGLAVYLSSLGVKSDTLVGVMVNRTVDLLVGLLAILKAGGGYLPLASDYPDRRISYILEKSQPEVLLVDSENKKRINRLDFGKKIVNISTHDHENFGDVQHKENKTYPSNTLIYVIFTSGTTGNPKGVMVEHQNVMNFIKGMQNSFDFSIGKRIASLTTISFDIFVLETWVPLCSGMQVVMGDEQEQMDTRRMSDLIMDQCIDMLQLTPSRLKLLYNYDSNLSSLKGVSELIVGGEAFPSQLLGHLHKIYQGRLYNVYGPTETTVWSSVKELTHSTEVTLGVPIANTQIYIIDWCFRLQPVYIPGELLIGGKGMVRGYLNNPELSDEKFCLRRPGALFKKTAPGPRKNFLYKQKFLEVSEPFFKKVLTRRWQKKIYKTGDLARWLYNGELEFLGRIDHQVKVRGFRIELEEIQEQLLSYKEIKEAIIIDRVDNSGETILCAYLVWDKKNENGTRSQISEVQEYLSERMPPYMIPSYFFELKVLPMTPNGKLDREQLPIPGIVVQNKYKGARDQLEEELVEIWINLFKKSGLDLSSRGIGIDDHFFRMGGHSLMAVSMISQIHKKLDVEISLGELVKFSTIRLLAKTIRKSNAKVFNSIQPIEKREYYELSSGQKRLYILQQMDTESVAYNISNPIPLSNELKINGDQQIEVVFKKLIQRHESFRTSFHIVNDRPVQRIFDHGAINIRDLVLEGERDLSSDQYEEEITKHLTEFTRPFDLTIAPLIRVKILKTGISQFLLIDMHHIIADGTSLSILEQEFIKLFSDEFDEPLRVQYKDFSSWQNSNNMKNKLQNQGEYWLTQFSKSKEIPVLNLPIDFPRPNVQLFDGWTVDILLSEKESQILRNLGKAHDATRYMSLLAIYTILLSKLSGQEEIIVGTPIAARRHTDLEEIVGMFVNTLAMRNYPLADMKFSEYLNKVRDNTLAAYENQEYQFEDLVEKILVPRDTSRNPLFDVMLNFESQGDPQKILFWNSELFSHQNNSIKFNSETESKSEIYTGEEKSHYLKKYRYNHRKSTSKFDLSLSAFEKGGELLLSFEYSAALFKPETIERFIGYFRWILKVLEENHELEISKIDILNPIEKKKVLELGEGVKEDFEDFQDIPGIFHHQAKHLPENIALIYKNQQICYQELNVRSDELALLLIQKGVKRDSIVGLFLEPSLEMMVGILGILKSGGAYLPIATSQPVDRINYMLSDSQAVILITTSHLYKPISLQETIQTKKDIETIFLNDIQSTDSHSNSLTFSLYNSTNLAYIIYTSGSTGIPKGVLIDQGSLLNLLYSMQALYPFNQSDSYLLKTTYMFDVSLTEIFGWILGAGRLAILEKGREKDPLEILKAIVKYQISHINFVPSMFRVFLEVVDSSYKEMLSHLKYIFIAGESLPIELVKTFKQFNLNIVLANLYGPTESTIYSSYYSIDTNNKKFDNTISGSIPIGISLPNLSLYILNKYGHLQPLGVSGELYIGGKGLSRGYLNKPELTAEKYCLQRAGGSFCKNRPLPPYKNFLLKQKFLEVQKPFFKKVSGPRRDKLYKTGDLCRWFIDGNIEFLGRLDSQVKIRGYRIELGEIESQLRKCSEIDEAIVLAQVDKTGEPYLCSYIIVKTEVSLEKLRESLSKKLPDYMIPSYFVKLDQIPLTESGKIDRRSLPLPNIRSESEIVLPRTVMERKLAGLFSLVLGVEESAIGIDSHFFQLGGHSLKATVLLSKIFRYLDVQLNLSDFFRYPTIRGILEIIKEREKKKFDHILAVEKRDYYNLSSAQKRLYILQQMDTSSIAYNIPYCIELPINLKYKKLQKIVLTLIKRHESFRTSFHMINEEPVQRVYDDFEFNIETIEFSGNGDNFNANNETEYTSMANSFTNKILKDFTRPFDLSKAPLFRIGLIKLEISQYLMLDMHHIISDGVSLGILQGEFLYLLSGEELPLSLLRLQYKDYASWQRKRDQLESLKEKEKYWIGEFSDELPLLNLPTDYSRPQIQKYEGNTINFLLDENEVLILKNLAYKGDATLYISLLLVYTIWLSKLSGQEDLIVGTPIVNRRHTDLEPIIGMFVNTLAMRNYPLAEKSIVEYLNEVKARTLLAFENQEYQFENLVDKVSVQRDTSRNPIFDVMLNLLNQSDFNHYLRNIQMQKKSSTSGKQEKKIFTVDGISNLNTENEKANNVHFHKHLQSTSKFDLNMTATEQGNQLLISLEYSTLLFEASTIDRYIGYFRRIIQELSGPLEITISKLYILKDEEKEEILRLCNGIYESVEDKTLHRLFQETVQAGPNRIGLVFDDLMLSYGELDARSNFLSQTLNNQGVGIDCVVGLILERSVEMIWTILGILKAGGAYLPIDFDMPNERIKYILSDSKAFALLTTSQLLEKIDNPERFISTNNSHTIYIDKLRFSDPLSHSLTFSLSHSTNLAYIIYTSGTTGRPKGVMIDHVNIVNLFKYQYEFTNIDTSRTLQFTTISFDVSIQEIFSALLTKGTLFLINKEKRIAVKELFQYIGLNKIKTVFFPMSFLRMLFGDDDHITDFPNCIEHIITAGEQVVVNENFRNFLKAKGVFFHNHYGPSETHVVTTLTLNSQEEIPELPSIGKPILNTSIYILDAGRNLLPIGISGELYIGGIQVGRGYLNNPELTNEKFCLRRIGTFLKKGSNTSKNFLLSRNKQKFLQGPGAVLLKSAPGHQRQNKLYKTGDLSRWISDGNIEFLGRMDHQVKIRGFRVELGEIESRLLDFPSIKECVVIAGREKKEEQYLYAYLVSSNKLEPGILREQLLKNLPDYMVPSYFVFIDEIPVTISGKVDHKALPKPEIQLEKKYIPPRNDLEWKLAKIWTDVLCKDVSNGSQEIGIDNNFFELGGQSLKATVLISKIHRSLQVKVPLSEIFKNPTILGLSQYINEASRKTYSSIQAVEKRDYYPLTSAQKRLYILQQIEFNNIAYNMPGIVPFKGDTKISELESIFEFLIHRHESLRTSFHMKGDQPIQRILSTDEFKFKIKKIDTNRVKTQNRKISSESITRYLREFVAPFDLSKAPLLRVGYLKIGALSHYLLFDLHHIISDGVSIDILSSEYLTLCKGDSLTTLRLQYKDFSIWQNRIFEERLIKKQKSYWVEIFSDEIPVLDLPQDYTRPLVQSFEGHSVGFELSDAQVKALRQISKENNTTMFITILSFYTLFLSKLSSQEDIVVGSPIANRRHADLEGIIGVFINSLAFRNFPSSEKTFKEFFMEVKAGVLSAYENQEYPFEDLVNQLEVSRDTTRNPLFDVMLNMVTPSVSTMEVSDKLTIDMIESNKHQPGISKFDMTMIFMEVEDRIHFTLEYCSKLFRSKTINRFIQYFKKIVNSLLTDSNQKLSDIEIITDVEKEQILNQFNQTEVEYSRNKSYIQLFSEQVSITPDRIALIGGSGLKRFRHYKDEEKIYLTYHQLHQDSDGLAQQLIEENWGAQKKNIIGLMTERTIEMVISLLGILKSGSAYLPIGPEYPIERVSYMLENTGISILVVTDLECPILRDKPSLRIIDMSKESGKIIENADAPIRFDFPNSPSDLIYVIYTSGTTGIPKGVMIENQSLVNFIKGITDVIPFGCYDRILSLTTLSFDIFGLEVLLPLAIGSGVVMGSEKEQLDAGLAAKVLLREQISIFQLTPSRMQLFLSFPGASEGLKGIRHLIVGGEAFPLPLLEKTKSLTKGKIYNVYGPTETTIWSSIKEVTHDDMISIGKPLANTHIYIVDCAGHLQPVGISGELCISGCGLARGYFKNSDLTKEKFHSNPFYKSLGELKNDKCYDRIYRTGDLGRWLSDGNIECLGRIDHQVKLRGFRIELGEIEAQLLQINYIKESVVKLYEKNQDKYLCAYIIFEEAETTLDSQKLNEILSHRLPSYMIPSFYIQLDQIPLNANGKINRKALPIPDIKKDILYIPPENEIEKLLVNIWLEVLNIDQNKLSVDENFFSLGGHSLKATVMISKVHQQFNTIIPLAEIFKNSTIRDLAKLIESSHRNGYQNIPLTEKREYYPVSSAQKRIYILQQLDLNSIAYNMPYYFTLHNDVSIGELRHILKKLIIRHESLRTSFHMLNDEPIQRIQNSIDFEIEGLEENDLIEKDPDVIISLISKFFNDFIRPFDLSQVPLIRLKLIKTVTSQILFIDLHHIITDGKSQFILQQDFSKLLSKGSLDVLCVQYKDFVYWQNSKEERNKLLIQGEYWLKKFSDDVPVLHLPTDYPRPHIQNFSGETISFQLSKNNTNRLKEIALEYNGTLYLVLLTTLNILFSKLTGEEDIVIGSPVGGRRHAELDQIVGMFVNTIPIRNTIHADRKLRDIFQEIIRNSFSSFENQDYPFEILVEQLNISRDMGRNPLFDVMLDWQDLGQDSLIHKQKEMFHSFNNEKFDQKAKLNHPNNNMAKFDLTVVARERDAQIQIDVNFCTALFMRQTIERWTKYFQRLLESFSLNIKQRIFEIDLLSNEERKLLLFGFNQTSGDALYFRTLSDLYSEQSDSTPNNLSLIFHDQHLTFRELNLRSSNLAMRLNAFGVKRENGVGILLDRSVDLIISLLGILKAGGYYLPLDPELPQTRIDFILIDSQVQYLISKKKKSEPFLYKNLTYISIEDWQSLKSCKWGRNERNKKIQLKKTDISGIEGSSHPSDITYIIYTSGTTGLPRGVMIKNYSVVNLILHQIHQFKLNKDDRILQFSTISFDASVEQIFLALLSGAGLVLIDKDTLLNVNEFETFLKRYCITHLNAVPSFLKLLKREEFPSLKRIISGGESCPRSIVKGWGRECRFYNQYGPTEATITSTGFLINDSDAVEGDVPIGKPISNTTVYILDRLMQLVPLGVSGELYIGGVGVARGYLNRVELTKEKFGHNLSDFYDSPNEIIIGLHSLHVRQRHKIYRSGDLGRWQLDQNIEFLGRLDTQVKIRGFRIELGEIENHLLGYPSIKECVVIAHEEKRGDQYLCAYIVADKKPKPSTLRVYAKKNLPDYMVPSTFLFLDEIPVTLNGKINYKALPKPQIFTENDYTPPRNELEWKLEKIWREILFREPSGASQKIGIDSNFFDLGGQSLKATMLIAKLHQKFQIQIPLTEIFKNSTIRALATYIKKAKGFSYKSINPIEKRDFYYLSPAQKRLFILQQLNPESSAYNMPFYFLIPNHIFNNDFEKIFIKLLNRHESLRTSFHMIKDEPVQRIQQKAELKINSRIDAEDNKIGNDIKGISIDKKENQPTSRSIINRILRSFVRPFDLSKAPLIRIELLKTKDFKLLLLDMHHIITDGTSQGILKLEFVRLISGEILRPLRLHYKDYSYWQNNELQQKIFCQQEKYWLLNFSDTLPVLNIPSDFPRPSLQSFEGNEVKFLLSKNETEIIKSISKAAGATLYMTLLTIYGIFLSKLSGLEDIIIGTPIASRRHMDLKSIIGMFVNTLAIRSYPTPDKTLLQYMKEVKRQTLFAFENQEYQFEELVEKISLHRDTSRNPIFDAMLNLLNQEENISEFPDFMELNQIDTHIQQKNCSLKVNKNFDSKTIELKKNSTKNYYHQESTSKFDLNMTVTEEDGNILISWEYSTSLFLPKTINRYIGYFRHIIEEISGDAEIKLSAIDILQEREKQKILQFCNGIYEGTENKTLHGLFQEVVQAGPNKIGLVFNDLKLTYQEIEERSNCLAQLLNIQGVVIDRVVGLMLERSAEMIFSILGILKSGGAYLPVDPVLPGERINYMLADSGAGALITTSLLNKKLNIQVDLQPNNNFTTVFIDDIQFSNSLSHFLTFSLSHASNLAYVIYTSGTTGRPKGVMINHINVVNLFNYQYRYTNIDNRRIMQFATISFDASFHEIFSALLYGGVLYLINKEKRSNIEELFHYIEINQIRTVFFPMSFLRMLFGDKGYISLIPHCLDHIQTAGEQVVLNKNIRKFLKAKGIFLHNHYGPSETHVVTTLTLNPQEEIPELPSIGKPILNTSIYILDIGMNLLSIGISGELYIGGIQVGRGYLNNPELTNKQFCLRRVRTFLKKGSNTSQKFLLSGNKQKFLWGSGAVFLKSTPGCRRQRIYKTGDLCRWLGTGNIEFLGRIDTQVKIRGFRVELGEIESRLLEFPGITECVIIARKEESVGQYLCAYIVSESGAESKEIREFLLNRLPDYMVPSTFVQLEKIPITINGKVNHKELPEPKLNIAGEYIPPQNDIEWQLERLWKDILFKEASITTQKIGIESNFFEMGGQSLKATVLISKLYRIFKVQVPLSEVFRNPTIRGLSAYIQKASKSVYRSIQPVEEKEYYPLSSSQKRLYILNQLDIGKTVYNMPGVISLAEDASISEMESIIHSLIKRHESFRTSFYLLNGEPVQRIQKEVDWEIHRFEKSNDWQIKMEEKNESNELVPEILRNFMHPFDLSTAPLLRIGLYKLRKSLLLLLDMHHIISDGVSIDILTRDFLDLQKGNVLTTLRIQYKDFSIWQGSVNQQEITERQKTYWLESLSGEIPLLDLTTDYNRPLVQSFDGCYVSFAFIDLEILQLMQLTQEINGTFFITLLSLFNVFLSKLSGQEDIIIGTPVANRRHADLESVIGVFINSLPIRNFPSPVKTFKEFLNEVKNQVILAFENQEYPFEELMEQLEISRDTGRNPLFDVMINLLSSGETTKKIADKIDVERIVKRGHQAGISKFDMTLIVEEIEDGFLFTIEYCSHLFQSKTIDRFIQYFKNLVNSLLTDSNQKLSDIEIITDAEKEQILNEFNQTEVEYSRDKSYIELFSEQVSLTPNGIALIGGSGLKRFRQYKDEEKIYLTYHLLHQDSDGLARQLIKINGGSENKNIIGLMTERTLEMVIGLLGILKSGSAYLPIGPEYPSERVSYMLDHTETSILVVTDPGCPFLSNNQSQRIIDMSEGNVRVAENKEDAIKLDFPNSPSDLIYVIYTSGTTGIPKGVMIENRSIVNFIKGIASIIPFGKNDRVLSLTTLSFDIFGLEVLLSLAMGSGVVMGNENAQLDVGLAAKVLTKEHISIFQLTPSRLQLLLSYPDASESLRGIRHLIVGGEALPFPLLEKTRKLMDGKIYNVYGPTETTIWSTIKDITFDNKISIGKPLANTHIYIVNLFNKLQPVGIAGELCISGHGLARGYFKDNDLTKEKFVSNPFIESIESLKNTSSYRCIYRTGDLARWLWNGNIEFLGRIDHQVKLRGYRIELGEIESQLLKMTEIKEAVVLLFEKGQDKHLSAYIVFKNPDSVLNTGELKEKLSNGLPFYMLPSYFIKISQIPLTANGKINRKALPAPEIENNDIYIAPRNEIEKQLVIIWSDMLGIDRDTLSISTNFFTIGGNSLLATMMVSKVHQKLNVMVPLIEVFKNPTIEGITSVISVSYWIKNQDFNENNIDSEECEEIVI